MALVPEDGTGKSDANGYVSLDDFRSYWSDRGKDFSATAGFSDTVVSAWIILATEYIDMHYKFRGEQTFPGVQALMFPREILYNRFGVVVPRDSVPDEVKIACFRIAAAARKGTGVNTDLFLNNGVKSRKMGPASVTFKDSYKEDYNYATGILAVYIKNGLPKRVLS